jgi:hypothetical protein
MPKPASAPAFFLNLDLEMESSTDLSQLAEELGRRAILLYHGPILNGYRLSLEPAIDGTVNADAAMCTEHFLGMLESLTANCAEEFRGCRSRVFDYGFDGGLEANRIHAELTSSQLARIAALGVDVRITIYPYRADEPEDESEKT